MIDGKQNLPDYSLLTYLWILWLSWWGAAAAYLGKIKGDGVSSFSLFTFFCEITISGFVGVITFFIGDWQELDPRLIAVSVAISGHFSTRALFLIRNKILSGDEE